MGIISKHNVLRLIADTSPSISWYAPIEGPDGIEYRETRGQQPIAYHYVNVKQSPKGLFFPQTEVLCRFCQDHLEDVPLPQTPFILFGARPCDARSFLYLDRMFGDHDSRFPDPYYIARREQALVITLACHTPAPTCFCTTVGGCPTEAEGSDLLVFELGDDLLFESWTDKGRHFLDEHREYFQPPSSAQFNEKEKLATQAANLINEFSIDHIKEKLDAIFEEEVWERITATCLGCGVCTYLCPTCHCFDITDERNRQGEGHRLRTWDSCQYPLFTKHASGHNPRVNPKQRMRQRLMHKFSYTVENNDAIFCVGCGRCVLYCPVNLDIREMLQTLYAEKAV